MFGIGEKKKNDAPVGAKAKIAEAQEQMRSGADELKAGQRGKEQDDTLPILVAMWGVAVALLLLLMMDRFAKGFPFKLPDPALSRLLLGMPPPGVAGDKDLDLLAAALLRGLVFFLLAGLVPGLVKLLQVVRGKGKKKPALGLFWAFYALILGAFVILR